MRQYDAFDAVTPTGVTLVRSLRASRIGMYTGLKYFKWFWQRYLRPIRLALFISGILAAIYTQRLELDVALGYDASRGLAGGGEGERRIVEENTPCQKSWVLIWGQRIRAWP